jgi:hypothetical protein
MEEWKGNEHLGPAAYVISSGNFKSESIWFFVLFDILEGYSPLSFHYFFSFSTTAHLLSSPDALTP